MDIILVSATKQTKNQKQIERKHIKRNYHNLVGKFLTQLNRIQVILKLEAEYMVTFVLIKIESSQKYAKKLNKAAGYLNTSRKWRLKNDTKPKKDTLELLSQKDPKMKTQIDEFKQKAILRKNEELAELAEWRKKKLEK